MRWIMIGAAALAVAGPAEARDSRFDRAVSAIRERMALIDQVEHAIPGRAVVMVRTGEAPLIDVRGVTRVEGGAPLTADTPMYIASMTKAFTGLMAVRLDSAGVFPLETTIGEVFPTMRIAGVDMNRVTMRRLLSHQLGFRIGPLNMRTAYTDQVPIADYPAIANAAGESGGPAFDYDNLGYLLYAAALEQRTGRSWRAWIDDVVFDPLAMTHSSARTSDFPIVSALHERLEDRWRIYPPKSDVVMHAAGGLVVSAADMARWLSANAGARSPIPRRDFARAQTRLVDVPNESPSDPIACTGYAFGWRECSAYGLRVLEHGGAYTGMRSGMIVLPDAGVGFAVMFNSDSMTGGLGEQLIRAFLAAYAGAPGQADAATFAQTYAKRAADFRARRTAALMRLEEDEEWGRWRWHPTPAELTAVTGVYRHPALGRLTISAVDDRLAGDINGTALTLRPAKPDLFGATLATSAELQRLTIDRASDGSVTGVTLAGMPFRRDPG